MPQATPKHGSRLPRGVVALGFVSLFMDMSSELVHSLLPALFVTVLGTQMVTVGIVEGIAEATAAITKIFSGALSDWLGKRKVLALLGYGLSALTKPLFPLAGSAALVFAARFVDRIGKGIRGAPRDALVADLTPIAQRGAAYGLRQSLDTVGAFLGPLIAVTLMLLLDNQIRSVLWFAIIPALVCVGLLAFVVREPSQPATEKPARLPIHRDEIARLPRPFWWIVILGGLFSLARFSEAFLTLRGMELGLPLAYTPLVMILMSLVYALSAYPAGVLADRLPRTALLLWGLLILIGSDLLLASSNQLAIGLLGIALWGLHLGLTQGLLSAMVADAAPADLRATAFGLYNLVSGLALLLASVIAGVSWQLYGSAITFYLAAGIALTSVLLLARHKPTGAD